MTKRSLQAILEAGSTLRHGRRTAVAQTPPCSPKRSIRDASLRGFVTFSWRRRVADLRSIDHAKFVDPSQPGRPAFLNAARLTRICIGLTINFPCLITPSRRLETPDESATAIELGQIRSQLPRRSKQRGAQEEGDRKPNRACSRFGMHLDRSNHFV